MTTVARTTVALTTVGPTTAGPTTVALRTAGLTRTAGNEGPRSTAGSGSLGDDEDPGDGEDPGLRGGGDGPGGEGPGGGGDGPGGDQRVLPEVTVPLVTLQGRAARAGESRLLGPLDPALARDLAVAAARSPSSRWEVTVVDEHGYAAGHGIARPRRSSRQQPRPPGMTEYALPARINVTVTETRLRQLAAQAAEPRSGAPPGRLGSRPANT